MKRNSVLKKKWVWMSMLIFVVVTLVGFINAGCTFAASRPHLTIWFQALYVEDARDWLRDTCEKWGERNNVDVSFEWLSDKDIDIKGSAAVETGIGPDIILLSSQGPILYSHALMDLTKIAKQVDEKYEYFRWAKNYAVKEEKWYGVPLYCYSHMFMYRKDIAKELGETPPNTWEDVKRFGLRIIENKPDMVPYGQAQSRSWDGIQWAYPFWWSFGGKLVEKDGKTLAFKSQKTLDALEWYMENFIGTGVIPKTCLGWDDLTNNNLWLIGKLGMTANAMSIYYKLRTEGLPLAEDTGHIPFPAGPDGRAGYTTVWSLSIMENTKNPDMAKKLVEYLYEEEKITGFLDASLGAIAPVARSLYEDMPIWSEPEYKEVRKFQPYIRNIGWPGPVTEKAVGVLADRILIDMFSLTAMGRYTPYEAMEEAYRRVQEIYSR
jgi:multiple sugar transport system substrate-binding protein